MVDTALLIGAKNQTLVEEEMWELIGFESDIAQVFLNRFK
jgi:hypothetical protein